MKHPLHRVPVHMWCLVVAPTTCCVSLGAGVQIENISECRAVGPEFKKTKVSGKQVLSCICRGKLLNVRDASVTQINAIKQILGLQHGKVSSLDDLRM